MKKKTFLYEDDLYTVEGASTFMHEDEKAMRREYTRLRDIAQKRLKRLKQSEYGWTKTAEKGDFKKLKDIDKRDLPKAMSELAKFVGAKSSTISGQKEMESKTTSSLNRAVGATGDDEDEEEYEPKVTHKNYRRVIQILNQARKAKMKVLYGSDKIVELAERTLSLSDEQFEVILDNLEAVLPHSDDIGTELEMYKHEKELKGFDSIDMDDFMSYTGWKQEIDTEG